MYTVKIIRNKKKVRSLNDYSKIVIIKDVIITMINRKLLNERSINYKIIKLFKVIKTTLNDNDDELNNELM